MVRLDGNNAAEGRRILAEAELAVVEQVDTMDDARARARPSSRPRAAARVGREHEMAIFLTGESRIIVQGITGSEGRKHTAPDARRRHQRGRRHQPAQGRPDR